MNDCNKMALKYLLRTLEVSFSVPLNLKVGSRFVRWKVLQIIGENEC